MFNCKILNCYILENNAFGPKKKGSIHESKEMNMNLKS